MCASQASMGGTQGMPPGYRMEGDRVFNEKGEEFKVVVYDPSGKKVEGEEASRLASQAAPHMLEQLQKAQQETGSLDDVSAYRFREEGIYNGEKRVTLAPSDQTYTSLFQTAAQKQETARSQGSVSLEFSAVPEKPLGEESKNVQKKSQSIFEGIGKFFKKMEMPKQFLKIQNFFEKTFTPEAYKNRMDSQAEMMFQRTGEKFETISSLKTFNLEDTLSEQPKHVQQGAHTFVPKELMMNSEERKVRLFDKKIGARKAAEKDFHENVPKFENRGIMTVGYVVDAKGGNMHADNVIPTSFRQGKPDEANHLMNCYLSVNEEGNKGVMRTGVVDTPEKAAEFIVAAKHQAETLGSKRDDRPLRVASHQVNSPEREGKMIDQQHQCLAQAERKDKDVQVAHINMPSNRYYEYTQDYGHLDPLGVMLGGEKKSHQQNTEGMATYLGWIVEDLEIFAKSGEAGGAQGAVEAAVLSLKGDRGEGLPSHLEKTLELRDSIQANLVKIQDNQDTLKKQAAEIGEVKKSIQELSASLKVFEQQVKEMAKDEKLNAKGKIGDSASAELKLQQAQLDGKQKVLASKQEALAKMEEDFAKSKKEIGEEIRTAKKEIREAREQLNSPNLPGSLQSHYRVLAELEKNENLPLEHRQTIGLFRRLMGMQLEIEGFPEADKMERGQELLSWALLNQRLGVVMAINCKSGLDRTGFFHAAIMALMEIANPEDAIAIVNQWDSLTKELNNLYREHQYDTEKVYGEIKRRGESENPDVHLSGKNLNLVFQMRQNVLDHMLNVGLPITGHSTGLIGLKWGKGMDANRIPLNFIPPVVQVVSKVTQEIVDDGKEPRTEEKGVAIPTRLVEYNSKGKPEGLTNKGHRLLTQLSPQRGA